jgi:hypothetical protein
VNRMVISPSGGHALACGRGHEGRGFIAVDPQTPQIDFFKIIEVRRQALEIEHHEIARPSFLLPAVTKCQTELTSLSPKRAYCPLSHL